MKAIITFQVRTKAGGANEGRTTANSRHPSKGPQFGRFKTFD